ncbi:MAG: hypothetical protein JJU28_16690 [Cyclobacteriaceae bacterium]|nr:hypothetical protein [Cyclobacteriaceae bacterium]
MKVSVPPETRIRTRISVQSFLIPAAIAGLLFIPFSCFNNYYRSGQIDSPTLEKIEKLREAPNYVILHKDSIAWYFSSIVINEEEGTFSGKLSELPPERYSFVKTRPDGRPNRYFKNSNPNKTPKAHVLDEVHIFVKPGAGDLSAGIINIEDIERVEVYDKHTGANTASHLISVLGVAYGTMVLVAIIVLLTKDSCPFVYMDQYDTSIFVGEIYSGAIFKALQRDDYLKLPFDNSVHSEKLTIQIANQLKERQYTDMARLICVQHDDSVYALLDKYGRVHTISKNQPHLINAFNGGIDYSPLLASGKDESYYIFNDTEAVSKGLNDLEISCPVPIDADEAKLVIRAKNSLWGDYVFGEFTKLFGNYYPSFIAKQRKADPEEHMRWQNEQGLTLNVYIKRNEAWEFHDFFHIAGPLAFKEMVMPIPLAGIEGNELSIKLESGFMLWEIDHAFVDFSKNAAHTYEILPAASADNHLGKDVRKIIENSDEKYLRQFEIGDFTELTFEIPGGNSSLFLHTRGYYEHIRNYSGFPDRKLLETFKIPGNFSKFSRDKLIEVQKLDWVNTPVFANSPEMP